MRPHLRTPFVVFLGYTGVSVAYFGLRLLPDPTRELVGFGGDPQIFAWSFAWWPHAIGAGQNPLFTDLLWAPDGIKLSWVTTVPALSLLYAPLTLAGGAVLAYNAAAVLAPALAATTCYLLCRHVTHAFWPSLVGGYLFGFSSYMLGQTLGHLHMTGGAFLVPLVALFLVRRLDGSLGDRGLAWRLGLVLAVQLWISTEMFLTVTVFLLGALLIALAVLSDVRPRLLAMARPLSAAYALSALLGAPLLVYAMLDFEPNSINRPQDAGADLLNFLVPTRLIAAGAVWAPPIAERFAGNDAETTAYLGPPVLAVIVWFAVSQWRCRGSRFLVLGFVGAAVAALGTSLRVAGHELAPLPWDVVARLPFFNHALPVRFSLYASLAAAIIFALWLRTAPRPAAVILPALAVLVLLPRLDLPLWHSAPIRPAFFSDGLFRQCLARDENVFTVPYNAAGHSLLWQIDADFGIRMPGGYVRPGPPPSFTPVKAVWEMHYDGVIPHEPDLRTFFSAKHVDRAVVELGQHDVWRASLAFLGPPSILGGVAVYPRCGTPLRAG